MEKKPVVRYFYKGEWLEATVSDIGDMTTLLTQSKNSIVAAINELYATGGFGNGKIPQNVQEKLDEINGAVEGINDFINSGGLNDTMAQQVQDKLNGVNTVINEYIRQVQDELSKDLSDARKEYADKVQTVENALEGAKQSIADSASALEKLKNDLIEIDLNVTTVSQEVDTIKGELSTKVETSDFDLAQAQIRQNTTNISQNANEIAMKVSEDTFNAATERITQAEAALVVQANLIESKVTSEEVREEIDKIDKYRPNLFKRTRDWEGFVPRDKTKFSVTSNTYKQCHIANFTTNGTGCYQIVEDLVIGETYTISVFVSSTSSTAVVGAKVGTKVIPMAPIDGAPISTAMNRYSGSFVAGTDSTIEILFRASSGSMAAPKLEKGKDASPWQPHVDDDYAKIVVNETSIKQTDDRITQTVKTIEQQGEDIEINSTAINQLGDSIGLQANKITDIEGKVVDNTANLNIAFNQISTKVSQTDVDSSIADISLDGSNKILNSDFGDDFENWYEVSPQFRIVDFSGMKCAFVERSGLTADLTLSLATNKFALSKNERLMYGFGFGTKDKTKIDKTIIAKVEIFDINDILVDSININLTKFVGLVNGEICRFNDVYLCERDDAAKARLKFQLSRNGSVYFTRPMAQLGSIGSTDWSLNPEDLVQRKIKYESAIEQTADRITSTVKEYTDGEVSKAIAQAEEDFKIANDNALKAQTDATNANTNLNNLSKDTVLTPIEKRNLAKEWETIKSDYTLVKAQCEKYGISASTLTTRYNTLNTYVPPLLTSITTSSTIVPATFRANFKNYYDEKVKALNLIADRVKTLGDTAASDALETAKSYADSRIEQTASSITSTVKEYTDSEVGKVNQKVDGMEIGGRNLIVNYDGREQSVLNNGTGEKFIYPSNSGNSQWITLLPNTKYTMSTWIKVDKTTARTVDLFMVHMAGTQHRSRTGIVPTTSYQLVYFTFTTSDVAEQRYYPRIDINQVSVADSVTLFVKQVKLEKGTKCTDWSPAPEDVDQAISDVKTYAESKIEQTADSITSEVTNYTDSEIEGLREYTDSKIEQTADSITTEVKEYTTEEVGKLNYYEAYSNSPNGEQDFTLVLPKRNFCDGSEFTDGKWKFESNQDERLHTAYAWSADGTDRFTTVYPRGNLILGSADFSTGILSSQSVVIDGAEHGIKNKIVKCTVPADGLSYYDAWSYRAAGVTKAGKYTLMFKAKATANGATLTSFFYNPNTTTNMVNSQGQSNTRSDGQSSFSLTTAWQNIWVTWTQSETASAKSLILARCSRGSQDIDFYVTEPILVEGGVVPTIYTPAPSEDYANAYPLYEGTYTDYSETASQNPADYTWKAVSKQNIPVYSHTAYSWSEDGQNRFTDRYPKENLLSMENLGVWPLNTELAVIEGTQKVTLNSTSTENLGVHCQNETTIKIGEKYTLSYELKVLSGTVIQIGGHIYGYNQEGKVKVNGTEVDGTYATGFPYSLAAGSTNKIELKLVGSGVSGTLSDGVYIQPNRGAYTTSFNAEVTNIKLEKGHDGATIYTPSPIDDEAECYPTYIGKYTDNLEVASSNPATYSWQEITGDRYVHRSFSSSLDGTKNFSTEFPNENLLLDSDAISLTAENAEFGRYFSDSTLTELTCSFVKEANAPSPSKYVVQGTSLGGNSNPMAARSISWHDGGGQITLEVGETYTMSCMARLVSGSGRLRFQYGINPYYDNFQEIHSSEWRHYSWTFTAEQPSTRIYMPAGSAHLPGVIQTCCFKLEKGAVATSYTPALSEGLRDTYPSFIGTYSDEEEDDSNSSEDYNWTILLNLDGKYDLSNKDITPIVNEEISYCLGGDNFIPPKNGWSVEIPVMARDYLLYSKTVWTFKDGLSETAFRVHEMGRHGSNGLPKTYDSEAKMVYEHSAYSWSIDGTERFAYMYPRENLIKNSSFKQSITNIWDSVGTSPIELETVDEYDALKIELTSRNPSGVNTGDDLKSLVTDGKLSIGDIVSYQMLMKADVDSTDVFVGLQGSGINKATPVNLGVDWKLVTIENEVFQDDNTSMRVYSTNSTNKGTNVYIANVKLERGRSCTVYTPKPSENPSAAYPMYIGTYESNDIENSRKPELYSWRQIEPGMIADSGTTTINKQGSLSLSSQEVDQPSMSLDGISDDSDYVLSIYAKATVESDVRLRLIEYVYTDKAPTSTVWIDSLQTVGTEWGRIHASCLMPKNTVEKDNYWVVSIETFQPSGTVDIKQVKLETGTEPTTFLKAPEENETESRMQYKGISLVGGEEFESYTWFPMTANDIDLHEVLKKVNEASANMTRFEQDFDSFEFKVVNPFISSTNEMLGNIESYMRFSDSGLKLGRSDSPFFVNLSGEELGFYNSPNFDPRKTDISEVEDDKIAWINGSELHIKMAIIENTIQLGRHTIDKLETKPDITVVRFAG